MLLVRTTLTAAPSVVIVARARGLVTVTTLAFAEAAIPNPRAIGRRMLLSEFMDMLTKVVVDIARLRREWAGLFIEGSELNLIVLENRAARGTVIVFMDDV